MNLIKTAAARAIRLSTVALGLALVAYASATPALAIGDVPEVDPTSMTSALTLLVGGAMALTGRIRRAK